MELSFEGLADGDFHRMFISDHMSLGVCANQELNDLEQRENAGGNSPRFPHMHTVLRTMFGHERFAPCDDIFIVIECR